ncbi:T9SS type A sorting domain-containing protein [Spirosoma sp. BT702]|uniref:T9SS type A sorting domain-containing protein n=1 Tax=Spirosoma profusum TaxID=2771354 RepID=A0A927AQW5_9BACT|nr:T9SS type A sorting domain-containing protein [Spirosoma profusum]MBD2701276.1 T9SS type A sorting domain-containing protein [Spirosoma profusum]
MTLALLLGTRAIAQPSTLETQPLPVTTICPGSTIDVTAFRNYASAEFRVELSNGGNYYEIPSVLLDGNRFEIKYQATIPGNTPAGNNYRIRMVSKNPDLAGTPSSTVLTVKGAAATPVTASATYCQGAMASPASATASAGGTLIWYATASGGSNLSGAPTPSTASPGVATYYVSQTINGSCESPRATVQATIQPTPSAPSVSQSNYSICQNSPAQPLSATGQNLKWYETASGGTSVNAVTPNTANVGTKSYYVSQTVNGCESTRAVLSVVVSALPVAPTVPSPIISVCQYTPAQTLTANGQNLKWYDVASGGSSLASAPQSDPSTPSSKIYYVSQTVGGCEGPRASLTVTVRRAPDAPSPVKSDYEFCEGETQPVISFTLPAITDSKRWIVFRTATKENFFEATTTNQTLVVNVPNVFSPSSASATSSVESFRAYVLDITGCASTTSAPINVKTKARPSAPATTTLPICQNSPAQSLSATGQNLLWYTNGTGGIGSSTAPTVNTGQAGQTTYYVSQTRDGCEGPRNVLTVNVQAVPVAPTISQTSFTVCQGTTATISATVVPGLTSTWMNYGDSPAPTNTSVNNNVSTATIPTDQARTLTYSLIQTSSNGCKSPSSATATVTVKTTPSTPSVQSVSACQGGAAPALSANGQGLLWYTNSLGGTGSSTTPVVSTSQAGQFSYYVSQSIDGCESARVLLPVSVNNTPSAPSLASPIISVCQNTPAQTLTADGQNLRWYDVATGGNPLTSVPQSDPSTPSSKIYYVSQTVGGCEGPRASLTVTVRRAPDAPSPVKSDYEFCEGETQPVISFTLPAITDSKRWIVFRTATKENFFEATTTNQTLVVNVPNVFSPSSASATSSVESFRAYVLDITGCASTTSAPINVKTKALPPAPTTAELSICQSEPAKTLTATGQNLLWYTAGSGGTGSSAAPAISTNQPGQTTYYVSQTREGCEGSRNALTVTVKQLPSAPGVTPRTICAMSPSEPASAAGENLTWYNTDGTKLGSAPVINTDRGASYSLFVTQTVNGCEGPKANLLITVVSTPIPAVAKAIVELCQGSPPQALSATGSNLKWTEPNGNVTNVAPMPSTNSPTARPDGDEYSVTQTVNGCESTKASIRVFVQATPKLTLSGSVTTNIGLDVPLKLTFGGVGPYQYKLSNGIAGTATKDTTISVSPTQTTTYQVLEITNKCGAGPTGIATAITVTVLVPTIRTLALTSTTLCVGTLLTTSFQTTGAFNSGSVFKLQVAKVETDTTKMIYIDVPVSQTANGQLGGLISNTLTGGAYAVRVVATNPKVPINGSASPTTLTIRPMATATLTGNPTVYEGQPARLTVVLTGDAPWSFSYRDSTSSGLGSIMTVQTSTNPHSLEVRPTKTSAYLLTGVSNGCGAGSVINRVSVVTVTPLLGIEDQLLVDAVDVYPIPTTSTLTVRIRGLSLAQPATLELTDINGRTIHQQETRQADTSLSLETNPPGTYLLRIRVGDRTAAKRIVKE